VRIEEHILNQHGWIPISNTNARVENLVEPEAAWREMRRKNSEVPYNACFPRSISSGQPVRVRAVPQPPVFYSDTDTRFEAASGSGAQHAHMLRRIEEARDAEVASCLSSNTSQNKERFFADVVADHRRILCNEQSRKMHARYSLYLLYWCKSTSTDTCGAADKRTKGFLPWAKGSERCRAALAKRV
jgi:hypothetical protein